MKAARYHEYGGPDVLTVDEIDRPSPERGELLVEVRATSVNPVDIAFREGWLGRDDGGAFGGTSLPATTGTDFAGVVAEVSPDVADYDPGDRVFGTGMADNPRATLAEYAAVPADHVALLPEGVPFELAAAAAHVGGTAWRALVTFGRVTPGDTVLIHGGSGGVGHMAVQIGTLAGATVVATASSERARSAVADLGAVEVVDYRRDDLADALARAGGAPFDLILDPHTGEYLELDVAIAGNGGRVVHIEGAFPPMDRPNATRTKELTIQGVAMHNTPDVSAVVRRLGGLLADGALTALIDRTYDLSEVSEAQRAVTEDHVIGKVVVTT